MSLDPIDALLADFAANSGGVINPPEAAKVIATQTVPEIAGQPEPIATALAVAPPTEKPAEIAAAEAAKKTRGRKPVAEKSAGDVSRSLAEFQLEDMISDLARRGYTVTLTRSAAE